MRCLATAAMLAVASGLFACKDAPEPAPEQGTESGAAAAGAPETDEPAGDARGVVERAIEASGGLDGLKAKLSAMRTFTKGTHRGSSFKYQTTWRAPDKLLVDTDSGRDITAHAGKSCWTKRGEVVVDCRPAEAESGRETVAVTHLLHLYPLLEPGIVLKLEGDVPVDRKVATAVSATSADLPTPVTIAFDKESGLPAVAIYNGHFGPTVGTVKLSFDQYRSFDGVQVPGIVTKSFNGNVIMHEAVGDVTFAPVEPSVFARPAQAPLDTPRTLDMPARLVAMTRVKGSYDQLGPAIEGLYEWANTRLLVTLGTPTLVLVSFPTRTNPDAEPITEVRLPIARKDALPAPEGAFEIVEIPAGKVVQEYVTGSHDHATAELMSLARWAVAQGLATTGPGAIRSLNDPESTAPDALISEIWYPVQ